MIGENSGLFSPWTGDKTKMSKTKVYIDGQSGTTGLQIFDRIGAREDLELLRIDEDKRHDNEERRRFLNAADIVFLCLPDDGAREAVSLIDNPEETTEQEKPSP